MPYSQQVAQRVQSTKIDVNATGWTALEGSTPLSRRFMTEIINKSSQKVYLSYSNTAIVKDCKAIGMGEAKVEPNDVALTLYGRCASGTSRLIITEYGL